MPKKTPEELREKVVALRKQGATYTQIEAQVLNPETGQPLARPTTIKILREAGLTASKGVPAAKPTSPPKSAPTPSASPSMPAPASSNGVDDFMPPKQAKKPAKVEFQCDQCGTEFVGDEGDELPESCPECGA